ncbi:MAG: glutathione-disulfide reductase [Pseudanabaenaceae cyanobacterium]|jgi:glutathione reductase (NADPH)
MTYDYDLFVIGAGSGGLAASKRAASYGAKVAIAEGDLVGGTCVIRGCVPKKLMVYASQFSKMYDYATGYGWSPVSSTFDWNTLRDSVQKEVMRLNQLHISFLGKSGVELINGLARLVDAHTVAVTTTEGEKSYTAARIIIAVGGEAVRPTNIKGIEHAITSREIFNLPKFPQRFVVIGGGYIGVEFAGIMNGLGATVTQIIRDHYVLRGFDQDIRSRVQAGMINHHIDVQACVDPNSITIEPHHDEFIISFTNREDQVQKIHVDTILAATGRRPNLDGLGLENAGIETKNGAVVVHPDSATNQPHIYAIGDCTNRVNLTPVAIAEGRALADTIYGHNPRAVNHRNVPSAVFSQPEAATVGLTEYQAKEQYGDLVKVYHSEFRPMIYSLPKAEERVFMKLIVVGVDERVVGMHMVGKDAAEIIQGMALVITMGGTKRDLDNTMAMHPTTAEEFVTMR